MATALGELEARLLAYTQMRRLSAVRSGELAKPLRLTATQERYLLARISHHSWRTLYLRQSSAM